MPYRQDENGRIVPVGRQPMRGLGDAVERVVQPIAQAIGIDSCGGCAERQALLNRLFPFRGRRS